MATYSMRGHDGAGLRFRSWKAEEDELARRGAEWSPITGSEQEDKCHDVEQECHTDSDDGLILLGEILTYHVILFFGISVDSSA
jgi:hypothetical protein